MNEAPGPINFTMFLTMFGERLQGRIQRMLSRMHLVALMRIMLEFFMKID